MLIRVFIAVCILVYILFSDRNDIWKNDYFFRILNSLVFMATLVMLLTLFRPQDGSEMLVEVNELLDETLTEVGPVDGDVTQRLDSEEYG